MIHSKQWDKRLTSSTLVKYFAWNLKYIKNSNSFAIIGKISSVIFYLEIAFRKVNWFGKQISWLASIQYKFLLKSIFKYCRLIVSEAHTLQTHNVVSMSIIWLQNVALTLKQQCVSTERNLAISMMELFVTLVDGFQTLS